MQDDNLRIIKKGADIHQGKRKNIVISVEERNINMYP